MAAAADPLPREGCRLRVAFMQTAGTLMLLALASALPFADGGGDCGGRAAEKDSFARPRRTLRYSDLYDYYSPLEEDLCADGETMRICVPEDYMKVNVPPLLYYVKLTLLRLKGETLAIFHAGGETLAARALLRLKP